MCKDSLKKSNNPKKLKKEQKDLPRFKVIVDYEKEFKTDYAKTLSAGLDALLRRAKNIVE